EHADDAGHCTGCVYICRSDEGVRYWGSDEHSVKRPLAGDIIQVPGRSGEQRAILAAEHGASEDPPWDGHLEQVKSLGGHACVCGLIQLYPRMPAGNSCPWASIRSSHIETICSVVSVAAVFGSSSAA